MKKISDEAKDIYRLVAHSKTHGLVYDEEKHCLGILQCMIDHGTISSFCAEYRLSEHRFYKWVNSKPKFAECYFIGRMISRDRWERRGEQNANDPDFNYKHWENQGNLRFNNHRQNRIRLALNGDLSPYEQYQAIMKQAATGEFTADEIKKVMESINVGRVAWESEVVQSQINEMKEDIKKMGAHSNVGSVIPIESLKKAN